MLPPSTPRLAFRPMTGGDVDEMAALLGDPDVMRYYPAPKSRQESAAWIEWNQRNYSTDGYGLWVIETHAGEFVGDCGLTWQRVNGVRRLEVGYHIGTHLQGVGYATEAAAACRDLAREHGLSADLVAIVHPENRASARVAEKIGMRRVDDERGGAIPVRHVWSMRLAD